MPSFQKSNLKSPKSQSPEPEPREVERIFVIDDDALMAECIARAASVALPDNFEILTFADAISAMSAIGDEAPLPSLILLDVLLDGPNGFTFLNELCSYSDTAKIPVMLISSIDFRGQDLSAYGVVEILDKSTMLPQDISQSVQKILSSQRNCAPAQEELA